MKEFFKKIGRWIWKACLWFLVLSVVSTIVFRWVPIPITPFMIKRCIIQKMDSQEMRLQKDWVSADEISAHLQLAVVCSEDQNFLKHF